MKQSIGIALSGGVDSTAAALLLKRSHEVVAFFMDIGQPDFIEQKQRVEEISSRIGIDIQVIDLKERFKTYVVDYFTSSYFAGKTPNPCMICNREIKFGLFMDAIADTGMAHIATGHYARTEIIDDEVALLKGKDTKKDQSYFLSRLDRNQLSRIVFPLGSMHKKEIYSFVENQGFSCFRGKESQDICFLANSDVASFLEQERDRPPQKGVIMTTDGKDIGHHNGLFHYTIGQRRGLGLPDTTPWYVCGLNPKENILIVGKQKDLFAREISVISPHWLQKKIPENGQKHLVRLRYSHAGAIAAIKHSDNNSFKLFFNEPQRAIAPGQFAVLYENDRVIGSGEIYQPF